MGLFYSIISYFYQGSPAISKERIQTSAQKLAHGLQQKKLKLQKSNSQLQAQFIEMVNQPKRDLFLQKLKIDNMISGSIKYGGTIFVTLVYEELYYCAQRIRNQANLISTDLTKVSDECLASIYSIVHLYKDLELQEFIDLKQFIPEPYPEIGVAKLESNIRKFLEFNKPTEYERNIYVLEMEKRHQGKVSVLQLNKLNHGFMENPPLPQNQADLNSNNLYARSASYQITNQQYDEYAA